MNDIIQKRIDSLQQTIDILSKERDESTDEKTKDWYYKRITYMITKKDELEWILKQPPVASVSADYTKLIEDFLNSPVYERNENRELVYVSENGKHSIELTKTLRNFIDYVSAINEALKNKKV